ncbi:hypothetical protein, partial [Enterococcus faecium]|uniref:hypothetical protein n=1 Tax=Enterococcus faecium TaxID=1352 RepID=UPI003DA0C7E9
NGYAAGSLGSDAASLIPGANAGNIGSIRQGSGTAEGAAAAQPKPLGAFGGGRMWQYPDGSIVSDEGYLLQPTGNGLYFDTGRGVLRNGTGMI